MRVEIWSDVTCPWCGIGHHRLQEALARFPQAASVTVVHRSFLLNKHAPGGTWPVPAHLMGKYGLTEAETEASIDRIEKVAAQDGISPYHLRDNVTGNTALAHEMLAHAKALGLGSQAWDRLFRAYFGEARSVFEVDSLVVLGDEVGLDPAELRNVLDERRYRFNVETDDHAARARGVEGVPYLLFAERYAIAGAESVETILRGLTLGWEHAHATPVEVLSSTGAACGPEGCRVP